MKIKFGSIVTDGRGKLGGHVFTKNRHGSAMRTKVSPVQPHTSYQQVVKSRMITAAQAWRGLTDTARAGFNSLSEQVKVSNVFGDANRLSGLSLFVRLNREIAEISGTPLTAAPTIPALSSITSLTLTGAAGSAALSLAYLPTPVPAGFKMVVQFTPQVSAGSNYAGSKFRTLTVLAAATASPLDALSLYVARFGALVAANRVFAGLS